MSFCLCQGAFLEIWSDSINNNPEIFNKTKIIVSLVLLTFSYISLTRPFPSLLSSSCSSAFYNCDTVFTLFSATFHCHLLLLEMPEPISSSQSFSNVLHLLVRQMKQLEAIWGCDLIQTDSFYLVELCNKVDVIKLYACIVEMVPLNKEP